MPTSKILGGSFEPLEPPHPTGLLFTSVTCMGDSFVLFDVSMEIHPKIHRDKLTLGNVGHTRFVSKSPFTTCGKRTMCNRNCISLTHYT